MDIEIIKWFYSIIFSVLFFHFFKTGSDARPPLYLVTLYISR